DARRCRSVEPSAGDRGMAAARAVGLGGRPLRRRGGDAGGVARGGANSVRARATSSVVAALVQPRWLGSRVDWRIDVLELSPAELCSTFARTTAIEDGNRNGESGDGRARPFVLRVERSRDRRQARRSPPRLDRVASNTDR